MFRNTFQSGFLSILYSLGSKPLQIWESEVQNGSIKRITDEDLQSAVLELASANVATTYIACPADSNATLGIKLPFLVMVVSFAPVVPYWRQAAEASESLCMYSWNYWSCNSRLGVSSETPFCPAAEQVAVQAV